jgi:ATP-dependent DNA ligase
LRTRCRPDRKWIHEIKHDGYRLIVRRDGATIRLFTLRGHDWTDRYPAIAAAAAKLRAKSFTMDGEAVPPVDAASRVGQSRNHVLRAQENCLGCSPARPPSGCSWCRMLAL